MKTLEIVLHGDKLSQKENALRERFPDLTKATYSDFYHIFRAHVEELRPEDKLWLEQCVAAKVILHFTCKERKRNFDRRPGYEPRGL